MTVVLTTHYLEEAEQLCERIAIINHGELVTNKPTRELVGMMGEKIVAVTVEGELTGLPADPRFRKCEKAGENQIEITYDKGEMTAGQVLAAVQEQGFVIADVTTREADLEDVFVQLTSAA